MTIAALRDFIRLPDTVVFIGSGISTWSGLPNWQKLLSDLALLIENEGRSAELVRREIANGELLQAASYGVSKITPASFGAFIRKAMQIGIATPHEIHRSIVELGATGFITTNYDTLLEQALNLWRPEKFFSPPVTNRNLVELADIISARSSHFIFKPHGDANDSESIILTREHYRRLLPGGERHSALEALKTLLVTRPVLYIGFGLRDPDFIHLRDLLLNVYQGGVRDHWAIMPDVTPDEADYWRTQYGIKLHGYSTEIRTDGSRDHGSLLALLKSLKPAPRTSARPTKATAQTDGPSEAERVLALTRYTSGLLRRFVIVDDAREVRISRIRASTDFSRVLGGFDGWTTTKFLTHGPTRAYLIGLPGSGKSFALRTAVRELASRLQQACLEDTLGDSDLALPVFIDLKLFQGDLRQQIEGELPAGFKMDQLRGGLRLKVFLDAFNEMPSEHLEAQALFIALDDLTAELGPFDIAIASRTLDGIITSPEEHGAYEINWFDAGHVDKVLSSQGVRLEGEFAHEIRELLSRPFFLQLVASGLVDVPTNARPRDIFSSYMSKLQAQFSERFATSIDLLSIFSKVAYRAIDTDSEAFPVTWLTDILGATIQPESELSALDVINWLVARQVLTTYSGRRASFIHQSITEFCGATELARRSKIDLPATREIIASKKWDQCLFLGLALMEPDAADQLLEDATRTDLRLAISAARYAEEGQSYIVSRVLKAVTEKALDNSLGHTWIENLPVVPEHLQILETMVNLEGTIGGQALQLVTRLKGIAFKPELLDLLENKSDDFNFSYNGVAPALIPLLQEEDLPRLLEIGEIWQSKGDKDDISAVSSVLGAYETSILLRAFPSIGSEMDAQKAALLSSALDGRSDDAAFNAQAQLLLHFPERTVDSFALSLGPRDEPGGKFESLDHRHVDAIWSGRTQVLWDSALSNVCSRRPDLAKHVLDIAATHEGIEAIALGFCAKVSEGDLFSKVDLLLQRSDIELINEPFQIFRLSNLNWRGRELLFARSLGRDIPALRKSLLDVNGVISPMRPATVDLKTFEPVFEWIEAASSDRDSWWTGIALGSVIAHLGDKEVQEYCLASLAKGSGSFCDWVKTKYLHNVDGLTSEDLSEEAISSLLADLNIPDNITEYWNNPLGAVASDQFVVERLIPLGEASSPTFRRNLDIVLRAAGDRHGKRYRVSA